MSWQPEVDEIGRRGAAALGLGGPEAVARQHASGRLTARERIALLVDSDSWYEIGILAGQAKYDANGKLIRFTSANAIIGTGKIHGRKIAIDADDFTVRGGSSEATVSEKWIFIENYAFEHRMPLVRLVETAGGSVRLLEQQGSTKIPGYATWPMTRMLGYIPVVGIALGPCAGLGAQKAACAHFSIMVRGTSQVFAGGPPVVERGIGQSVDKEALGGSEIHTKVSGVIDNEAENEAAAFDQARRFLSYLPDSVFQLPPIIRSSDSPDRREEALLSIVPRNRRSVYSARTILRLVCDLDSVFEIASGFGSSIVTCLARLNGYPIGVMINDPYKNGGGMTRDAAEKMETFIDLCDTFHLPIVNFVDQPGTVVGVEGERAGNVRGSLRVTEAIEQSQVPWCAVIIRRLFGLAGSGYARLQGINFHFAWPSARWGSIPPEGGIEAAYRRELESLDEVTRASRLLDLQRKYEWLQSPFLTAERFRVPDIVDPRDTRPLLCNWIEDAYRILPEQLGAKGRTFRK
jgi:acetyl-CoA carboxylase carboxyltransferase component